MNKRVIALILIGLCLASSCVMIILFKRLFDAVLNDAVLLEASQIVTEMPPALDELVPSQAAVLPFSVFSDSKYEAGFKTQDEAVAFAKTLERAVVKQIGKDRILWDNLPPYMAYTANDKYTEFDSFAEALAFARSRERSLIYHRSSEMVIWDNYSKLEASHLIENVEVIMQYPELPRGCEVTSLAMLLNYLGVEADKMTLAEEVAKNPEQYSIVNGRVHFGDPNTGFVGSMTDRNLPGLGVYHGPVYELLKNYLPDTAVDATGSDLSDLYGFLSRDIPVWVIVTSTFRELPPSQFSTWQTENGEVKITYSEHSVLVTGYDKDYIYFNNPLSGEQHAKVKDFESAWIQMGRQAVSVAKH